ncbi:hypothetical protein X735_09915 [Mesorhizobium sp. L2C085B000]|uniref:hypothetical protein n=1 Tax=Mesorhizobium sp. L2C085B000 TaxID=1287117 RepID=UPI0003D0461B|nr:hypothetical protein [Mesorhizobium sp. L2C085B000]ESZ17701.1 hypothetical protein X735_09915 [Mesorhizobium sp. L2C085B000]
MGGIERALRRVGRYLDRNLLTVALAVSAVGLTFATDLLDIVPDPTVAWHTRALAGLALFVTVFGVVYSTSRQGSLEHGLAASKDEVVKLQSLIASFGTDYFDTWTKRLQALAEELKFDGQDRISVYRYADDAFIMVGRFSIRPELAKPGRSVYPANQGVIGAAWRSGDGKCVVTDLPDPEADSQAYLARCEADWQLPSAIVQAMTMKPRSIAAFALNNSQKTGRNAIVVFESTAADRFSAATLDRRMRGGSGKELVLLLEVLQVHEPSLEYAHGKGF